MSKPTGHKQETQSSHKQIRKAKPKNEKTPVSTAQQTSTRAQQRQPVVQEQSVSKNLL